MAGAATQLAARAAAFATDVMGIIAVADAVAALVGASDGLALLPAGPTPVDVDADVVVCAPCLGWAFAP